ncbi:unnamed protein product [Vitrella brassicaformis CCMP3155]|uniref:Uncharacterized protein n=1 Tax=Vitrella brassicaformis (strain CCMP3155) TaxID=1169540 RepID=A0A0G4G7Z0_VITBC|nr:unnamed protein product [Vitrella brassicaformis CCMP3155]|eukprot:CEM24887.1 unnamed protein product [Vitrella brassicaformis CCMP3155]
MEPVGQTGCSRFYSAAWRLLAQGHHRHGQLLPPPGSIITRDDLNKFRSKQVRTHRGGEIIQAFMSLEDSWWAGTSTLAGRFDNDPDGELLATLKDQAPFRSRLSPPLSADHPFQRHSCGHSDDKGWHTDGDMLDASFSSFLTSVIFRLVEVASNALIILQ